MGFNNSSRKRKGTQPIESFRTMGHPRCSYFAISLCSQEDKYSQLHGVAKPRLRILCLFQINSIVCPLFHLKTENLLCRFSVYANPR